VQAPDFLLVPDTDLVLGEALAGVDLLEGFCMEIDIFTCSLRVGEELVSVLQPDRWVSSSVFDFRRPTL